MTGIIISTPPTVELPPGNSGGGTVSLPPITYQYAVLNFPQTWTAAQNFAGGVSFSGTITGNVTFGGTVTLTSPVITTPTGITKGDVGLGNVQNADTTIASNVNFTQAGTGAVARSVSSKLTDFVSVKDFAVYDGITDDTAKVQAAIDATPSGGYLCFPSSGSARVIGSGSAVLTITKPINIIGGGMYNGGIVVDSTVPATRDIFHILPANGSVTRGYSIRELQVAPSSGFPGRHIINVDTSQSNTTEIAELEITRCYLYPSGGGYSVWLNNVATNTNGGTFNSNIDRNVILGGVRFDNIGDSIRIRDNIISTANAAISGSQIAGAGNLLITGNNVSGTAGGVVISGATAPIIENNEFEQQAVSTESNNAIIDLLTGITAAKILRNQLQEPVGNPTLIRIGSASGTIVDDNYLSSTVAKIINTASASGTVVGSSNTSIGGGALITDSGSGTIYASKSNGHILSVLGNASSTTTGAPTDIVATNINQVLKVDSVGGSIFWANTSVVVQKFTASGTYTPTSGMLHAIIECIGGGGGGGSAAGSVGQIFSGGGGGAGSYSRAYVTAATVGASKTVTIGAAGSGGASGSNNGTAGGDTSVGSLCIGKGGGGALFGSTSQVSTGGAGGVAGTGDITASGASGFPGFYNSVNLGIAFPSGSGASSTLGGGAMGVNATGGSTSVGTAAGNYGAGGSGGATNNTASTVAGGNGSAGIVIITEFVNL